MSRKFPRPQRLTESLWTSLTYLVLVGLILWLGACGPKSGPKSRKGPPVNPEAVEMKLGTEVSDPAAFQSLPLVMAPAASSRFSGPGAPVQKPDFLVFQNPLIEPPKSGSREVTFKVTLVTDRGSNPVVLSGEIQDSGRFNLDEERPSAAGAPLRAIGQCLEFTSCAVLYVDVFYIENGKQRKQQFLYQGHGSPKVSGGEDHKSAGNSGQPRGDNTPCDEFSGCEGQFVGHRVADTYYENLRDWKSPDTSGSSSPAPGSGGGAELKGENHPTESLPPVSTERGESQRPTQPEIGTDGKADPADDKGPGVGQVEHQQPHQGVPVTSGEVVAPKEEGGEVRTPEEGKPLNLGIIQLTELDLKEGAQSVGLPYTICFEPCAQGLCVKSKCEKGDTHRKFGALDEVGHGPHFLELGGGEGFEKLNPRRDHHYGSGLLVRILEKSALAFREEFDPKSVVQINDMSKKKGGPLGRHSSHQSGLDADIAYLSTSPGWRSVVNNNVLAEDFELERNLQFFKLLVETGYVNRIFVDKGLNRRPAPGPRRTARRRVSIRLL